MNDRAVAAQPAVQLPRSRRTEKISEAIAREIVQDIVARGLKAGAKLPPETDMLSSYGVGRASLREALRILEINGLIRIKPGPGGGPIVNGVSSHDFGRMLTLYFHVSRASFRELLEARLIMEPIMVGLVAQRRDPEDLERLAENVERTRAEIGRDYEQYLTAAVAFHDLLAGMSGNRILELYGRGLRDIYAMRVTEVVHATGAQREIAAAHEEIVDAIKAGDVARSERLMRQHMQQYHDFFTARMPGLLEEIVDWR